MNELDSPPRADILHEALRLTCGDRDKEYGPPYNNLSDCAILFSAYLAAKYRGQVPEVEPVASGFVLTAEDIAWFNVLQKMARTFSGKVKLDTYIDAAAYAAIAGECALQEGLQ